MEERRSAATADTMEEWWSAAAANALEVNR
jgi:hypothetical protein